MTSSGTQARPGAEPGAPRDRGLAGARRRAGEGARALIGRAREVPRPLAALMAVAAIHVAAWMAVTPPFQGPDAQAHFGYAQHVAETGTAPQKLSGNGRNVSTEQEQAMEWAGLRSLVGVLSARPAWSEAAERRWEDVEAALPPEASADGEGPNAVAYNPPLYYLYEAIPYHVAPGGSLLDRFYAMRIASAALYLAMIPLAWLLLAELFQPLWARTLGTAIVALHPKLASLGATVNPDVLLATVWAAFAFVAVRTLKRGATPWRLAGAGLLAAASVLTHGRGLAIVGPLLVLLALSYLRDRPERRRAAAGAAICLGMVAAGVLALLAFRALSGGEAAYAGEISGFGEQQLNLRQFLSYVWQFYLPGLSFMQPPIGPADYGFREVFVRGFFGDYASLEITIPPTAVDLLQIAMLVLLLALYTLAITRWRTIGSWWPVVALFVVAIASMILLIHVTSYRNMLITPNDPLFAGRYLLPLVPIFAVAVTAVVAAFPRRLAAVAAGLIVAIGIVMAISGVGMSLVRFYA